MPVSVRQRRRVLATGLLFAFAVTLSGCASTPKDAAKAADQKAYGAQMAQKGFWREALFRFDRAAKLAPDDPEILNNLAVASEAVGRDRPGARRLQARPRAPPRRRQDQAQLRPLRRVLHLAAARPPAPRRHRSETSRPFSSPPSSSSPAASGPLLAGSTEVQLKLPLRPKLAVSGRERISLAPFLVASKLSERKESPRVKDLDLDLEFRRYLGKQIGRRTKMNVVTMPSDVKLPSTELKALGEASEFWRELGSRVGADILLSGIVDFRVEDKSGYKTEEYTSQLDGRTYYRQVFVESTGFSFEVTVLAFDGRTGAKLFQETFKDQKEKSRRAADEMVGLFENLFSLENQLLGLFIVREREANRYVFD